jgi:hypothetical protein
VKEELIKSSKNGALKKEIEVVKRTCKKKCKCKEYYKRLPLLAKMFLPE